jgi:hypothetical protein
VLDLKLPQLVASSIISNHRRHVGCWHFASFRCVAKFVGYWTNNGQRSARRLNSSAANDPTATLAVHCGNDFDASFSPYQCTRLNRYDAVT